MKSYLYVIFGALSLKLFRALDGDDITFLEQALGKRLESVARKRYIPRTLNKVKSTLGEPKA